MIFTHPPLSRSVHLPDSPPLASQSESGPKVRVLEFAGTEQRQLRFPPCLRAGLAGTPAPDEFRLNWLVALSLTFQWLASTVCAPAMRKAYRNDNTPSPISTSPVPLSQALRMTNSVPCKFNSAASKPVSSPSSAPALVI